MLDGQFTLCACSLCRCGETGAVLGEFLDLHEKSHESRCNDEGRPVTKLSLVKTVDVVFFSKTRGSRTRH